MVGQNIGKYQVLDRLGRGGMGTVYRAMDETLRREVAIKVLNAELNDPAVAKRFHAEAITVARLSHPGIATVYELFQNEGQWLMVMEFVRGETLEALVTRKGALPVEQAADLCMQVLGALAHAHSLGVVHRNLKPANLMASESGIVKVMDFGIARVAGTEHLTSAGFMMGTPAYMAPEQVMGEDIDARCDIYAMGAVLFYLLTGQLPFKGKSPFEMAQAHLRDQPTPVRTIRQELPEWLELVITRALQRAPADRFQSAPQFHDALRRGLSGLPIDMPGSTSIPPELMATAPAGLPVLAAPAATGATQPEMMETILSSPSRPGSPTISTVSSPTQSTVPAVQTSSTPTPQRTEAQPLVVPSASSTTPSRTGMDSPPTMLASSAGVMSEPVAASAPVAGGPTAATGGTASLEAGGTQSPTSASAVPSTAPAQLASAPARKSGSSATMAIVAAVIVVALLGGWMWTRHRRAVQAAEAAQAAADAAAASAATPQAPSAAAQATAQSASVAPDPSGGGVSSPAVPAAVPPAATGAPPVEIKPAFTGAPAPIPMSAAPSSPAAAPARGPARGQSAAPTLTVAAPETFGDVRMLVVTGRKADERAVNLRFADGLVSAVVGDATTIVSIPDNEVASATFIRAKDPKWSPALAAPPANTDFPGGLFRSARNWLTLQSRSAFLILRLNDTDWRKVLDTVTTRTGVKIDITDPNAK